MWASFFLFMYNVSTILPLWVDHFQHPYHHSRSPTKRCPARLFSARCCSWMSFHALATHVSIILSHPTSSCAIAAPMKLSGRIQSSWNWTRPFPLTNVKRECWRFGCVSRLEIFLTNCRTFSSKHSSLSLYDQYNWLCVSSLNTNLMQQGNSSYVAYPHLWSIFLSHKIY